MQVLYIALTVISTVMAIYSVVKSVALAAVRQGLTRLLSLLRHPGAALVGLFRSGGLFTEEAIAAWRAFQAGRTPWWRTLTQIGWDPRTWGWIRRVRNRSFWFRPRLFGQGPFYNWEHIITQNFARRFPQFRGLVNSYLNTFLRLPAQTNSWLSNNVGRKLLFYSGALEALRRSWNLGQSVGNRAAGELYAEPGASSSRTATPATP